MTRRTSSLLAAGAVLSAGPLALAFCGLPLRKVPAAAPTATVPAPGVDDPAVVAAARAFAATLSDAQRAKLRTDMSQASVARWSNLPVGFVGRNGVQLGTLNPTQLAAALRLARIALGEDGFARMQEIRTTDDLLARDDKGPGGMGGPPGGFGGPPPDGDGGQGGPPGRQGGPGGPGGQRGGRGPGGMGYGAGTYSIAFLNEPSATAPWMLQIGGHHLAFNVYYKGATSAATPYFVGVEPTTWKDAQGRSHEPLKPMRDAMFGLVNSLTPAQKAQAKLDASFSDVYLGPRGNGRFPQNIQGVPVASLSPASQGFVKRAIAAWTGDCARASEYRKLYFSELAATKLAYSGGTTFQQHGDYVRIDGPHVWIEFVCQDGIVYRDQIHYHTVWRDRKTDYGASYAF